MLMTTIAQKTKSPIVNFLTGRIDNPRPIINEPRVGDTVRNTITGEIGYIYSFCDDPYDFSGQPQSVAYVICEYPDQSSNYSDHWHISDIEIFARGKSHVS